jgi:hypothetical protein
MNGRNVELHIEELVLDGFGDVDQAVLQQALHGEIARIIGDRGIAAPGSASVQVPDISVNELSLPRSSDSAAIGTRIAQVIAGGLPQ